MHTKPTYPLQNLYSDYEILFAKGRVAAIRHEGKIYIARILMNSHLFQRVAHPKCAGSRPYAPLKAKHVPEVSSAVLFEQAIDIVSRMGEKK